MNFRPNLLDLLMTSVLVEKMLPLMFFAELLAMDFAAYYFVVGIVPLENMILPVCIGFGQRIFFSADEVIGWDCDCFSKKLTAVFGFVRRELVEMATRKIDFCHLQLKSNNHPENWPHFLYPIVTPDLP